MTYTNRLKLPLLYSGQSQKEITHNEALNLLDVLINTVAQEVNINSPPNSSKIGHLYIIGSEPTGEFQNQANKIAQRHEHSWRFIKPHKWLEVTYAKDGTKYRFTGKAWEQAIEKGIINALKSLGLDADNLREVQQDFHFLRYSRKTKEKALSSLIGAITLAIIGGVSIAVWEVIKILLQ